MKYKIVCILPILTKNYSIKVIKMMTFIYIRSLKFTIIGRYTTSKDGINTRKIIPEYTRSQVF